MNYAKRIQMAAHHFQHVGKSTGKSADGKTKADGKTRENWILKMERALMARGSAKEAWASKVLTYLEGDSAKPFEKTLAGSMQKEDKEREVFNVLKERHPDKIVANKKMENFAALMTFRPEKGELPSTASQHFQEITNEATEQKITSSSDTSGLLLFATCRFSDSNLANAQRQSHGANELDKLTEAMPKVFPRGLPPPDQAPSSWRW